MADGPSSSKFAMQTTKQIKHMIGVIPPSKVIVAAGLLTHTAVNLKQSTGSDQMTNYACSDILQPATDDVVTPCEEMPS